MEVVVHHESICSDQLDGVIRLLMSSNTRNRPTLGPSARQQILDRLQDKFVAKEDIDTDFAGHAWRSLGLTRTDTTLTYEDISKALDQKIWGVQSILYDCLEERSSDDPTDEEGLVSNNAEAVVCRVAEVLVMCKDAVYAEWRSRGIANLHTDMHVPKEMELSRFSSMFRSDRKLTEFQNLLIYLIERLQKCGYRKRGADYYEEHIVVCNGKRHGTRAWRRIGTIFSYVHDAVDRIKNFEQWCNMTSRGDTVRRAAEYFENSNDPEFPRLRPSRYLFAFANGLYHTMSETFIPWEELGQGLNLPDTDHDLESMSDEEREEYETYRKRIRSLKEDLQTKDACRFLNQRVEDSWVNPNTDWLDIPTPAFDKILKHQKLGWKDDCDEETNLQEQMQVHTWISVLLGRMLYDVGELDDWQVLAFFRGMAGTGKSSIGKAVSNFYNQADVGLIASNIEKMFGLQEVYNKFIWVCLEAKQKFGLDQGQLQSMISGEPVSIAVKGKPQVFTTWKPPGLMCGNEIPAWADASGSIRRRILVFEFLEPICGGDPTLSKQLALQTAAFLIKCNRAYQWAIAQYSRESIWEHLPAYCTEKQKQLEMETDTLYYFVMANEVVERDPVEQVSDSDSEYFMSFQTFQHMYTEWCKRTGRGTHRMVNLSDKNVLRTTLKRAGLAMVEDERVLGNTRQRSCWIVGLRARTTTAAEIEEEIRKNANSVGFMQSALSGPPH